VLLKESLITEIEKNCRNFLSVLKAKTSHRAARHSGGGVTLLLDFPGYS
jgi:hypothetical protein